MLMEHFDGWLLNESAPDAAIACIADNLSQPLPADYLEFLRGNNGGEGFVGGNYLILWRAEELVPFNREYEVSEYAPGILLFGSNGGGEGYGFDVRESPMPVVRVPFVGMDVRYAIRVASGFSEFLTELAR